MGIIKTSKQVQHQDKNVVQGFFHAIGECPTAPAVQVRTTTQESVEYTPDPESKAVIHPSPQNTGINPT
jgi:hypothetical protein